MTSHEFAGVMAYLGAGVGKAPTREQTEVYFDLLEDLPVQAVQEGSRLALIEHRYASLPPVGLIRQLALRFSGERADGPTAWRLAMQAVSRYGLAHEERAIRTLPYEVANAVRTFGWRILCDATNEELGITQTQFLKVYDTLGRRADRQAIAPPVHSEVAGILNGIGRSIDEPALKEIE